MNFQIKMRRARVRDTAAVLQMTITEPMRPRKKKQKKYTQIQCTFTPICAIYISTRKPFHFNLNLILAHLAHKSEQTTAHREKKIIQPHQ